MVASVDVNLSGLDGRRARRERGRTVVIDALIDLINQTNAPASAAQVTERAGISTATLFRYFDTLDDLVHEATRRFFERNAAHFEVPGLGEGPLDERAARLAGARTELYTTIAPVARVARFRAPEQPLLAASLHDVRLRLASQVRGHFAPELTRLTPARRTDTVGAIAALTSFEAWDQLHADLGRSQRQIHRIWARSIVQLLS